MMTRDALSDFNQKESPIRLSRLGRNIHQSQETLYAFLLRIVRKWPSEEVLLEFKRLFIYHVDSTSSDAMQAVYDIVLSNNEEEFRNTLKRSCYILVNNWDATRHYKPIQDLVQLFSDPVIDRSTPSQSLKRLRQWIRNFAQSQDYEELKLFASKYEDNTQGPWSARYTSYLLVPQFIDLSNPVEQREAARALSKQLKDRFKFDLAMYIARSQIHTMNSVSDRKPKNPTALGDEVLRLIKTIVAKRGPFSYANLANIFIHQTQSLSYRDFKKSLEKYLLFAVENKEFAEILRSKLADKLNSLYESHDDELISHALTLRTCNRIIECLTTENQQEPSSLFVLLLSQSNPIMLVIALLKIILICKHSRTHLEACIANLIRYYQDYPEDECSWVVNFMEVFNVTFAIHAENVQYNLIKMDSILESEPLSAKLQSPQGFDPDKYRIFSQLKSSTSTEEILEVGESETTES